MLYCCLDGKHVKYAWNSWPRGWGGWEMECIFLPAKRNDLLSASPLILIKEFLELRCFSKRIEGDVLILFLRELSSYCRCCFRAGKKQEQSRKNPLCLLPLPRPGDRVIDTVCTSMPSSKATWSSAPGWTMGCSPSCSLWSFHRTWDSKISVGRNYTGHSAISPCICSDESLENIAVAAVSAFAFSALICISWPVFKGSVKDPGQVRLNKLAYSLKNKMSLCPLAAA